MAAASMHLHATSDKCISEPERLLLLATDNGTMLSEMPINLPGTPGIDDVVDLVDGYRASATQ